MERSFERTDSRFSICGLNCGLCPMQLRGECSGCFTDSPCYTSCPIASCSVRHGNVNYCFECDEYPCSRYDDIDRYDSLISHRNQKKDLEKAKRIGIDAYIDEQKVKRNILDILLKRYDSGREEVFYCLCVNMLKPDDLLSVINKADIETVSMSLEDKAEYIKKHMRECAEKRGISLRLRKWRGQ